MSTLIHTITTKNQHINDAMWIYRNPKGLKILENELEERRKRRSALNHNQYNLKESPLNVDLTPPDFFLERTISPLTLSPVQNVYQPMGIEDEKYSNQITLVPSKSVSKEPRKPQIQQLKPIKAKKLQETYNQNSFLTEAKQKLATVKNKTGTTTTVPPKYTKGNVVSSFISAFEKSSSPTPTKAAPLSSSSPLNVTSPTVTKSVSYSPKRTLSPTQTSPSSTTEHTPFLTSRSMSSPPLNISPQLQRKVITSPLTKIKDSSSLRIQREKGSTNSTQTDNSLESELSLITSRLAKKRNLPKMPRHQVKAPYNEKKDEDNEYNLISVIKQNLIELDDIPNIILQPCEQKSVDQVPAISDTDNDRNNKPNVYSPQLSPEIQFCSLEKNDNDADALKYKKLNNRKTLKKKVSFHDEPSYIPETNIPKKEEENEIQSFVKSVSTELRNTNAALIAAKKVNVNPREKFVPVSQARKGSPSPPPQQAPQRLSIKLLDMFQQKTSTTPSVLPSQNTVLLSKPSSTSQTSPQPLVHLTKTRPKKPASLKKSYQITMPTAAAQPDWRIRALPKKSIFA